jgi:hypothetical protein
MIGVSPVIVVDFGYQIGSIQRRTTFFALVTVRFFVATFWASSHYKTAETDLLCIIQLLGYFFNKITLFIKFSENSEAVS